VEDARASLLQSGAPDVSERAVRKESERLFYRAHEVRARAVKVNGSLRPDLVVCLHFNADAWGGDPAAPTFSPWNHLHVLAHGCMSADEFSHDDQRLEAMLRVVQGVPDFEVEMAVPVATAMAATTGLPPYIYPGRNAQGVPESPYVWRRNLLANRVYECPVVFLEPYVMNHESPFLRFHEGDYEGERLIGGKSHRSIFRDYVDGTVSGLETYFQAKRIVS
jgi:hypothetical protein